MRLIKICKLQPAIFDVNLFCLLQAYSGQYEVATTLLGHGADVTLVDDSGNTAVDVAKTKKLKSTLKGKYSSDLFKSRYWRLFQRAFRFVWHKVVNPGLSGIYLFDFNFLLKLASKF